MELLRGLGYYSHNRNMVKRRAGLAAKSSRRDREEEEVAFLENKGITTVLRDVILEGSSRRLYK